MKIDIMMSIEQGKPVLFVLLYKFAVFVNDDYNVFFSRLKDKYLNGFDPVLINATRQCI